MLTADWLIQASHLARSYKDGHTNLAGLVFGMEIVYEGLPRGRKREEVFWLRLALEEVYGRLAERDFDFRLHGEPVVDRVVATLLSPSFSQD